MLMEQNVHWMKTILNKFAENRRIADEPAELRVSSTPSSTAMGNNEIEHAPMVAKIANNAGASFSRTVRP